MPQPIGFRFEDEESDDLFRQKAAGAGLSPGVFAREVVLEKLQESNELHHLRESVLRLEESVQNLRRDIGFAAYVLLVRTKSMSEVEAKEWVRKNLVNRD